MWSYPRVLKIPTASLNSLSSNLSSYLPLFNRTSVTSDFLWGKFRLSYRCVWLLAFVVLLLMADVLFWDDCPQLTARFCIVDKTFPSWLLIGGKFSQSLSQSAWGWSPLEDQGNGIEDGWLWWLKGVLPSFFSVSLLLFPPPTTLPFYFSIPTAVVGPHSCNKPQSVTPCSYSLAWEAQPITKCWRSSARVQTQKHTHTHGSVIREADKKREKRSGHPHSNSHGTRGYDSLDPEELNSKCQG